MEDNKWQEPHKAKSETRSVEADQPLLSDVGNLDKTFLGADIHNVIAGLFYAEMYKRSEKQAEYIKWKNKPRSQKMFLWLLKGVQEEDFPLEIFECSTKMVAYVKILNELNLNSKPLVNTQND